MADELDLESGDPELADVLAAGRQRRAARSASRKKATETKSAKAATSDNDLRGRLDQVFDRIVKVLHERGDDELASIIDEDRGAMAQGLVSLTAGAKFLRSPLTTALSFIEPVLAFGRTGRLLLGRWGERNARIRAEREMATAGVEVAG